VISGRFAKLSADHVAICSMQGCKMKTAVILACLIGIAQPAGAQSLFGLFDQDQSSWTPEEKWRWTIRRQLLERVPKLNLGPGRVTAHFRVDRAGRVTEVTFEKYSSNAHALIVASIITSLKLPPPPANVGKDYCYLQQSFYFH
jgi:hypothetical protein